MKVWATTWLPTKVNCPGINRKRDTAISPRKFLLQTLDVMAWLPAFFLCSVITASVQGLPVITRDKELQRESEHQHHLVNGMNDPLTIEFIFLGHNKNTKQKDADQERHKNNFIGINNNDKDNKTGTISQSYSIDNFSEIVNTNGLGALKKGIVSFTRASPKEDDWNWNTQKASITRTLPKYLYALLPISAFPVELLESKETIELKKEKMKYSGFPVRQKTSLPVQIAGPLPFPQSTYAREFDLPFFE